jgi:hypothetical protein
MFNQQFADAFQTLCTLKQQKLSIMEAQKYCQYLLSSIKDEKLILMGMEKANDKPFVRTSTDKNGHTVEIPRMPTALEITGICNEIKTTSTQAQNNHQTLIGLSKKEEAKTKKGIANGHLAMGLVAWFACCPDFIWNSMDNGVIEAPDDLLDRFVHFNKGESPTLAKKEYIREHFDAFIDLCPKIDVKVSRVMPSLGMTLGSSYRDRRKPM